MKTIVLLVIGAIALTVITVGCKSLVGSTASPTSVPVATGAATTNDVNLVAWEKLALQANDSLNATPTRDAVASLLAAVITITGIAAGAYTHAHGVNTAKADNTPPQKA